MRLKILFQKEIIIFGVLQINLSKHEHVRFVYYISDRNSHALLIQLILIKYFPDEKWPRHVEGGKRMVDDELFREIAGALKG